MEILYYKYIALEKGHYPSQLDDGISFKSGTTIDFDTLFATFFETDWYKYTALESVTLRIRVSGSHAATVYRKTNTGDIYIVGRAQPDEDGVSYIGFSKYTTLPNLPARLWVVVDALSDVVVHELSWVTSDNPAHKKVGLGVCFATFNRLPYLKRVINDLLSNDESCSCVEKVFLVNQGADFRIADLVEPRNLAKSGMIKLINQDNFGGCGGFTRGIMESMADQSLTHILLCDDDIAFEPHSIIRLTSFLKYCRDDVAVGGQMLDILRPNFLYESGAVLQEKNLTPRPLGHNMYLGEQHTLDFLISQSRVDYNGWWYFAFSKKIVEKIALPMPCFIRGDDIEYGIRLKKNDIHTVVLPGVVVWHEPFYMKLGGWQYYYEVKNRLVLQVLHYQRDIKRDLNNIATVFIRDILSCRYYTAKLAIVAMEDFINGPEVALTCEPKKLADVRALAKKYGPSSVAGDYIPTEHCRIKKAWWRRILKRQAWALAFIQNLLPTPLASKEHCFINAWEFNIANTAGLREFIVREMDGSSFTAYRRSRKRFVYLLIEFAVIYLKMRWRYSKVSNTYRENIARYTSASHWRGILPFDK